MTASPTSNNCGRDFAEALARKDFAGIKDLLRPDIDFRGMTPNRIWEAADVDGVDDILQQWFEPSEGQIAWMRTMCSGFRPTGEAAA
jgi:hypothetical protein